MPSNAFDLETLLSPFDSETFFRDYWEQQPLVLSREAPDHYGGLFTTADVDRVIAFSRPRFDDAGAFSDSKPRESSYVKGRLAGPSTDEGARWAGVSDLQKVYARGKTIVIMAMQQRWGPIAELCRNLEGHFYCPVHANLYLTPKGAQGFDTHFDTHEVLVLQLEGRKHWRVYGSPRRLPALGEQFNQPKDELGTPREVHLGPGDLLYLPRGFVHEAFTSEGPSLHLTVGVNVYRWADLLHEALAGLSSRDARFRESLPIGALGDADSIGDAIRERFHELLGILAQEAHVGAAMGSLGDHFFRGLEPLPDGRFVAHSGEEGIGTNTLLERAPGAMCRVVEQGGWVEIVFPGGRVGGPAKIAPALRQVARTPRLRAGDLPDELGAEGKLVLARRLVRERLLKVVDKASSPSA